MRSHFPTHLMAMANIAGLMALPAGASPLNGQLNVSLTIQPACSAEFSANGLPLNCSPGVVPQAQLLAAEVQAPLSADEVAQLETFYPQPGGYSSQATAPKRRWLLRF